ncbi:hypothetical protein NP493_248g00024, partial [Ridgeia piscesae]
RLPLRGQDTILNSTYLGIVSFLHQIPAASFGRRSQTHAAATLRRCLPSRSVLARWSTGPVMHAPPSSRNQTLQRGIVPVEMQAVTQTRLVATIYNTHNLYSGCLFNVP